MKTKMRVWFLKVMTILAGIGVFFSFWQINDDRYLLLWLGISVLSYLWIFVIMLANGYLSGTKRYEERMYKKYLKGEITEEEYYNYYD